MDGRARGGNSSRGRGRRQQGNNNQPDGQLAADKQESYGRGRGGRRGGHAKQPTRAETAQAEKVETAPELKDESQSAYQMLLNMGIPVTVHTRQDAEQQNIKSEPPKSPPKPATVRETPNSGTAPEMAQSTMQSGPEMYQAPRPDVLPPMGMLPPRPMAPNQPPLGWNYQLFGNQMPPVYPVHMMLHPMGALPPNFLPPMPMPAGMMPMGVPPLQSSPVVDESLHFLPHDILNAQAMVRPFPGGPAAPIAAHPLPPETDNAVKLLNELRLAENATEFRENKPKENDSGKPKSGAKQSRLERLYGRALEQEEVPAIQNTPPLAREMRPFFGTPAPPPAALAVSEHVAQSAAAAGRILPYRPPPPRNIPPDAYLDGPFSEMIENVYQSLLPLESEVARQKSTLEYVQALTQNLFGTSTHVHQFGSTASGMSLRGAADMDLCLELSAKQMEALDVERAAKLAELEQDYEEWLKEHKDDPSTEDEGEERDDVGAEGEKVEDSDEAKAPKRKRRSRPKLPMPRFVLERLGEALEKACDRVADVKILVNTRIPIVKYRDIETNMNVDIGFNNLLAVHNTKLLLTYSLIDPRFKKIAMVIKHWAKRRFINDTYSGTLSSYAYVIMAIHYFQYACQPPLLPPLQTIGKQYWEVELAANYGNEPFEVGFLDDIARLNEIWPFALPNLRNKSSLGKLFYGFLHYWAHEFDFRNHVASIRTGGLLSKEEKEWVPFIVKKANEEEQEGEPSAQASASTAGDSIATQEPIEPADVNDAAKQCDSQRPKIPYQRYWFCVEDPFEVNHNLGRPVGRDSLYFIRGEFLAALKHLNNPKNFPRSYVMELYQMRNGGPPPRRHPDLLSLICEESPYKTREEHKHRNKENMAFSEKRKAFLKGDLPEKRSEQ